MSGTATATITATIDLSQTRYDTAETADWLAGEIGDRLAQDYGWIASDIRVTLTDYRQPVTLAEVQAQLAEAREEIARLKASANLTGQAS